MTQDMSQQMSETNLVMRAVSTVNCTFDTLTDAERMTLKYMTALMLVCRSWAEGCKKKRCLELQNMLEVLLRNDET